MRHEELPIFWQNPAETNSRARTAYSWTLLFFFILAAGLAVAEPSRTNAPADASFEAPISDDPLHLLAQVRIQGEDLTFMVDTGAERAMTVDTIVAKAYGPPIRPVKINQTVDGAIYNLPEARLGKMKIPAGEATAVDITGVRWTSGLPIAGAIGWQSLKGRTLVIDHEKKVLQIREGKAHLPDPVASLPVTEEADVPHVASRMGTKDVSLIIDTGDDGTISLVPAEFDRLVSEGWIKPSPEKAQVVSVAGVHWVRSGWFTRGTLFGVDLKSLSVTSSASGENSIGLLFLLKLNISISNAPSLFSYSLRKDPGIPISPNRMTGAFLLYRGGHGVVAKLKPGGQGQAEKAGLMLKDEITSIDELQGKPLNVVNWYVVCRQQAGKSLTLQVLRQGATKTIPLELGPATSAWIDSEAIKDEGK